jgi:hypothetical protein
VKDLKVVATVMPFCVLLQVSGALERLAVSPAPLTLNLKRALHPAG